jgi:hypothetical protein
MKAAAKYVEWVERSKTINRARGLLQGCPAKVTVPTRMEQKLQAPVYASIDSQWHGSREAL